MADTETQPAGPALRSPGGPVEPRFRKVFAVLLVVVFSALFLRLIWPYLQAVLLAAVLSGMLYPLNQRLRERLNNRAAAAALSVLIVFFVIIVPLLFIIGAFTREAARLSEMAAPWIESVLAQGGLDEQGLPAWVPLSEHIEPYRDQLFARLGDLLSQVGNFLVEGLPRLTQRTIWFVLNLFVLLYAMFFFFLAGGRWLAIFEYLPLTSHDRAVILEKGVSIARATIKGTLVIAIVQGALAGLAFAVVGLPGPVFWGVIMTVASIIPAVGAAIVWLPAVIILAANDEILPAVGLFAWCVAVVSTIDNVLRPRLIGSDTKMPDLLILLSTLGGIGMFGATGLILGPLVAGFFITSWHIFAGVFSEEFRRTRTSAELLNEQMEGIPPKDLP